MPATRLASCFRRFAGAMLVLSAVTGSVRAAAAADLPETCYLFSYFYHDREEGGMRLAWSADGYTFHALNDTGTYIEPEVGEHKLMRDPSLVLGPDGVFHLVWTTGWTGKTIGYASSKDLLTWSEQVALPVMEHEPEAQNCWAPEIIWDDVQEHYHISWSTTILGRYPETAMSNRRPERNHRIYYTTTKDFKTFAPTRLLYDGGYNVIDAAFIRNGDHWLMFVKDETLSPVTQKNIRMVRAGTTDGPFGETSPSLTGDYWAEGPSPVKVGNEWRVYFDKHMLNAISMVRSTDLVNWEDMSERMVFPPDARHGTVIPVPRAVIARLLAADVPAGAVTPPAPLSSR